MADQYPKRRHAVPAEPERALQPSPSRSSLSDDDQEEIARRKQEFLELMGDEGLAFFRALHKEGMIDGWRNLLFVSRIETQPDDLSLP